MGQTREGFAAIWAGSLVDSGAAEGAAIWAAIVFAIGELQRTRRPDDALN